MRRALVTGATGMLGAQLVEQLAASGWRVRALVRGRATAAWLEPLGAELAPGDLADAASLRSAVDGCDVVFNAAAAIGTGDDHALFRRVNVEGVVHLASAAAAARARLVHVSSTAVFGRDRYRNRPTDETLPLPELPASDAYGRSKQESERLVLGAHARSRAWTCVVRPPVMYGPRDRQFAPRLAPLLLRGFFPLIGGGRNRLPLVHAAAVADGAIRAALTDRAGGSVYHLTSDFDVTVGELALYAAHGLGRRVLRPRVPLLLGRAGFRALALGLAAAGRRDLAPHAAGLLQMLTRDNPFSCARARTELGWSPRVRPADGIPQAFRWWLEHRCEMGRP